MRTDDKRTFYDQESDEEPLRRSRQPQFDEPKQLKRHQADDEQARFWNKFKRKQPEKNQSEPMEQYSRVAQKQRDIDEENERKTRELGKKLNKVIFILIGLIVITYLIMRFVNF